MKSRIVYKFPLAADRSVGLSPIVDQGFEVEQASSQTNTNPATLVLFQSTHVRSKCSVYTQAWQKKSYNRAEAYTS